MPDLIGPDDVPLICERCGHGREACTFCSCQHYVVFKMICDCGLLEHGVHTIDCEIVGDEARHAQLSGGWARLQAEQEVPLQTRGTPRPVDWGPYIAGWTEADDEAWKELLDD